MEFRITRKNILKEKADGLVLFSFEGPISDSLMEIDDLLKGVIVRALEKGEFKGKEKDVYAIHTFSAISSDRVILVGLGPREKFTIDKLRRASALGAKEARRLKLSSIVSTIFSEGDISSVDAVRAIVEGSCLGLYRFTEFKTKKDEEEGNFPEEWILALTGDEEDEDIIKWINEGKVIAGSVNYVRSLVNSPGNVVTPSRLVEEARNVANKGGMDCKILTIKDAEKMGMGAFLSVTRGSEEPAYFIVLEYWGAKKDEAPLAVVGKAITFDSGGISIKPSHKMEEMKYDMAGGGTVLGIMQTLGKLRPSVNVIGIIPATENLPSGKAYKPGDVVKSMSGQTIEIISTDAEGRMILADALSYSLQYKPCLVIDMATLTGACIIALGHHAIGAMGNDSNVMEMLKRAGEASGEKVWELPLWEEYDELIKSDIADIKNVGNRSAGTIVGAMFLKRFVKDTPWIHLDIAGTAWAEKEEPYQPKGATGVGVRLFMELLKEYIDKPL